MDTKKANEIQEKVRKAYERIMPEFPENKWQDFALWLRRAPVPSRPKMFALLSFNFDIRWAFAGLSTCAVAACIFMIFLSPRNPMVANVSGTVKVYKNASKQWILLDEKAIKLAKNDIVKTFDNSRVDIAVPGFYQIRIKDNSEVKLTQTDSRAINGENIFTLAKGKAFSYLKKDRNRKGGLTITTSQSQVSAIGTNFMVDASPMYGKTWVSVLDGVVTVSMLDKKGTVYVEAGEGTSVRTGKTPEKPRRLLENELFELEELYSIGTRPQVALLISTGKMRTRELLSGTPLYISADAEHVIAGKIIKICNDMSLAIKQGNKAKRMDSLSDLMDIVNEYPNPKYDVQIMLFIGSSYEYLNEHTKAIEAFKRVLDQYPRSPFASIAMYAIGIIYAEKLNDPAKASEIFKKILTDYPVSPEAQDIRK